MASSIYRSGMTEEVVFWDSSGNNRLMATGQGSLILNAISAIRAAEDQDRELAGKYGLLAGAESWSTNIGHPGHDNAATWRERGKI